MTVPPGLWLTSPAGWLPRTRFCSRTLLSAVAYGLPLPFLTCLVFPQVYSLTMSYVPTYTHAHTRLTALCPGLPRWAGTRKVKPNLDFTEARDSEWQWHQLGHMQVCTSLQTDNQASTPPLSFFTGRMPFLLPNQQCQSKVPTYLHLFEWLFSARTWLVHEWFRSAQWRRDRSYPGCQIAGLSTSKELTTRANFHSSRHYCSCGKCCQ